MKYKKEVSAGGIVFKRDSNDVLWLITQHSKHKGWSFPKGLIGDGNKEEQMEEAALREVKEEGGVEARIVSKEPVQTQYKYRFQEFLIDKTVYYFLMEYVSGDPKDHDWEVSEAKFVPQQEIFKTLNFKTDRQAFSEILDVFERVDKTR